MDEQISKYLINFPSGVSRPKMALICFPFAGGGTVNYSRWRADLNADIELYALNFPGRERFFGKPCLTDYKALVESLAPLLSTLSNAPLVFFGHSFGALTAYFVALELKKMNLKGPQHVFVSARVPPSHENAENIAEFAQDRFKSAIIERYQGIPQQILSSPDLLNLFLPIIQQDFKLYEQYPQVFASYEEQQLNCDLTSIGFMQDRITEKDILVWKNYTLGSYRHIQLPGGHFDLLSDWKEVVACVNQV